nr:hypothetical protein 6 [Dehalococcoidia bacterium]
MPVHGYGELGVLRFFVPDGMDMSHDQLRGWLARNCLYYISLYFKDKNRLIYVPVSLQLPRPVDEALNKDLLAVEYLKATSVNLSINKWK